MQAKIISSSYQIRNKHYAKPMFVGCSGGGGHNSGVEGIIAYLKNLYQDDMDLSSYDPVLWIDKLGSSIRIIINQGVKLMHAPWIGAPIRQVLYYSPFPVLPAQGQYHHEIQQLTTKQQKQGSREYVDVLLDACPDGYAGAAIWNVTQREDKPSELKKLVGLQGVSDWGNYEPVYNFFLGKLKSAAAENRPFTEIISTQAMALAAICDAVKDYNAWAVETQGLPEIVIHQYMTDLPTLGAVHFFQPLSKLKPEQQKQMILYGVGMSEGVLNNFFKQPPQFAAICNIPCQENPMVRPGFKDKAFDNSSKFSADLRINVLDLEKDKTITYALRSNEKIASIMLGSQAGNDTFEYIEPLLKNGIDKVFVFGGKTNPLLHEKILQLLERQPIYQDKIIALANQNDQGITSLLTRSNVIVIRGGGLSVMEQMAMVHNPSQVVLFHHHDSSSQELTSGISWEDENVLALILELERRGVYSKKTSPMRIERDLIEIQLIMSFDNMLIGLSYLSKKSLEYLQFLAQHREFLTGRYEGIQQFIDEYLLPLDELLKSLLQQRYHLETDVNHAIPRKVYHHKLAVIARAISCLEAYMFPKCANHRLNVILTIKQSLMHAMRANYLYVHKSGEGYSQTEILVTSVLIQFDIFIDKAQRLSEEQKQASPAAIGLFKDSMPLQLAFAEKNALLAELKSISQATGAVDPRARSKKQMFEMAVKYLTNPSLADFNELVRLRRIYIELNKIAYVFMASNLDPIDKILALRRQVTRQNEQWVKVDSDPEEYSSWEEEQDGLAEDEEGFVLLASNQLNSR